MLFSKDFYSQNHWEYLPNSWLATFNDIEPEQIVSIFEQNSKHQLTFPLSILCIRAFLNHNCISRTQQRLNKVSTLSLPGYDHPKVKNILSKHIKPKKRHEIDQMSAACAQAAFDFNVQYIVDFGAGLGHLSRVIAFKYGLHVCCLEQQQSLSTQAM